MNIEINGLNNPFPDSYNNQKYKELVLDGKTLHNDVDYIDPSSGKSIALAVNYYFKYSIWLVNAINDFKPGHRGVQNAQSLLISTCLRAVMAYSIELTRTNKSNLDILQFALLTKGRANLDLSDNLLQCLRPIIWTQEEKNQLHKTERVHFEAMLTYMELVPDLSKQKKTADNSLPEPKAREGCYIATMVYGNYEANEVIQLRAFRDKVLAGTLLGRIFIKCYYLISPYLVKYLGRYNVFHRICKQLIERLLISK
jgi:hypothetical protein